MYVVGGYARVVGIVGAAKSTIRPINGVVHFGKHPGTFSKCFVSYPVLFPFRFFSTISPQKHPQIDFVLVMKLHPIKSQFVRLLILWQSGCGTVHGVNWPCAVQRQHFHFRTSMADQRTSMFTALKNFPASLTTTPFLLITPKRHEVSTNTQHTVIA